MYLQSIEVSCLLEYQRSILGFVVLAAVMWYKTGMPALEVVCCLADQI